MSLNESEAPTVINDKTRISLGLVIVLCVTALGLLGSFGLSIKWATTAQNKLDELLRGQAAQALVASLMDTRFTSKLAEHSEKLTALGAKYLEIDKFGSPPVRDLEKRVTDLERLFKK